MSVPRIGVGGPVGSGKTALMEQLCRRLREEYDIAAVTNDIYCREDAEFLIRKGGPGICRSDLLLINKIDLAPHVGADLAVMERDARKQRGDRPFLFTNLKTGQGVDEIVAWIKKAVLFEDLRSS